MYDSSMWRRCRSPNTTTWSRHDAEARQLERRRQQVGYRKRGHVGQGPAADILGDSVPEIGRQLVEQDQGRRIPDQVDPILLVRPHRCALVKFQKFIGLPQLGSDVPHRCLSREIERPEIATTCAGSALMPCVMSFATRPNSFGFAAK